MNNKKKIRADFRNAVFKRDNYKCVMCGQPAVDSHHIVDRTELPGGGYVPENGVSLCEKCHIKAEAEHNGQIPEPGYSRIELYKKINSSHEKAYQASLKL